MTRGEKKSKKKRDDKLLFWIAMILIFIGVIALVALALRALGVIWMDRLTIAIVFLDMLAIIMTAGWIIFNVIKGINFLEIFYNYVYVTVIIGAFVLSIIKMMMDE